MRCTNCSARVRPVVALDIDGTLGDWHSHFIDFLTKYLGLSKISWWDYDGSCELSDWLELDKRTYQDAKLAFRAGGYKRWMPPMFGLPTLRDALEDFGVETWITTTRPWMRLDNIDPDTRDWLRRHRISYSGLLFDESKYERLCEQVDKERIVFVLEDQKDLFDQAKGLELPVYLYASNWNRSYHSGRNRVISLDQASFHLQRRLSQWDI